MKRPTYFDAFKTERAILKFFGFPIGKDPWNITLMIKCTVSLIISVSFLVSLVGKVVVEENLAERLEALYFTLAQLIFLWKIFNILLKSDQFALLESYLNRPIFNIQTPKQDRFIINAISITGFFARMFRIMAGLTITFYAVVPYIEHSLPMPGWFPMDEDKYHILIYIYHLCAIILNGYNQSSIDCITASMISLAAAQFEISKENLENVTEGLKKEDDDKKDNIVIKRMRRNIEHHNVILNFVKEIEEMYSNGIFVQFLCSIVIMCFAGFQIQNYAMSPTKIQYVTSILYFLCNLIQLAIYCWFGHDLLAKSSGVGDACYMADWNTLKPNTNKMLFIVMERSKRPTVLTAGKFFDLTLGTLMTILRTSYSYLAVLQQMYK